MSRAERDEWGKECQQAATPTTTKAENLIPMGNSWLFGRRQVTTTDKRRLIEEVWSTKPSQPPDFGEWVWHGKNTSVEGVREGLAQTIADELEFCNRHFT